MNGKGLGDLPWHIENAVLSFLMQQTSLESSISDDIWDGITLIFRFISSDFSLFQASYVQ